jgi:hypothetical protein
LNEDYGADGRAEKVVHSDETSDVAGPGLVPRAQGHLPPTKGNNRGELSTIPHITTMPTEIHLKLKKKSLI